MWLLHIHHVGVPVVHYQAKEIRPAANRWITAMMNFVKSQWSGYGEIELFKLASCLFVFAF
ncbi:hypothetical protein Leryth_023140 [Lithospermum erythrorhizon]|nr:hypothetical protein Leryth_023140 [Lithospermum erythrorhizon]